MTTLRTMLQGDIPGLLQTCSPILMDGMGEVVRMIERSSDGTVYVRPFGAARPRYGKEVLLNLDLPTGRSHAACWVVRHPGWRALPLTDSGTPPDHGVVYAALHYNVMTVTQIDTLARLVLRLAGRSP